MQQRSLVRTRNLAGFRTALTDLALAPDSLDARRVALVVPTRAAGELLRQTIEATAVARGRRAVILPDLLTRDEWMASLHASLAGAPPLLSRIEREVLIERAALHVASRPRMGGQPFRLRPGLVTSMLAFYDELQRRQINIRRFARSLFDQLRGERGTDRGSEGLIHQTCFLGFTFTAYERGVRGAGRMDEHGLRRAMLREQPALQADHVIVAVADHPSDPRGLWPADFDLLGRLRGVERLDVVVTDEIHDAGFRERVERELPGIEEVRREDAPQPAPILVRPPGEDELCAVARDREEELRDVARRIRARASNGVLDERVAVVFERRLPYLYLAWQVFQEAGVPCQAFDALPLAAEPWAALLDLVLAFARTGGTREAAVAVLRSRMLRFDAGGVVVGLRDAAALDTALRERRSTGEADSYPDDVSAWFGERATRDRAERSRAVRAADAAMAIRAALLPFREGTTASGQVRALSAFLRTHETRGDRTAAAQDRQQRARAAVLGVLDGLADAYARFDDRPRDPEVLAGVIHHRVEGQTFSPRRGSAGVHLVDAVAAPFGQFDHVHLVGLVETDWPERTRPTVFYTSGLLSSVGWPQQGDRLRAHLASFRDLLGLAARTLSLHAFQLEGDAIVAPSPLIESARDLPFRVADPLPARRIFPDEVFVTDMPPGTIDGEPAAWLALRRQRPGLEAPSYSGRVDPAHVVRAASSSSGKGYRVSRVDQYVTCPFKYFAESVLGLPEEREEMSGLTPIERGNLVHSLFEKFYRQWNDEHRGTITPASLPDALALFGSIARDALSRLPEADRVLEETRMLGSIVARGLAERVFELEADAGGVIVDRLIETELRGAFVFPALGGLRQLTIDVRGKADRIDIFDNDGLRVIDYKLGRQPDRASVQIGVYAHCARQRLQQQDGRDHPVSAAMYLAFGEDNELVSKLGGRNEPVGIAVESKAADFAAHVEQIEAGQFPPRPRKTSTCTYCRYAGVCRKEYRVEPDAAGEDE